MSKAPKSSAPVFESHLPAPRSATRLIGQEAAEKEVLDAWSSGRMHHAWLLTGKRGIGKATLAYRIARFLLSGGDTGSGGFFDEPATLDMDDNHPVFRRVAQGSHGDLRVVERKYDEKRKRMRGEIVIEDVRAIGDFMSMTPAEGGWRVVIIDAADEMNRNSANALLKVLEEPPKQTVLLLVCHNPARLLPTIRSRCRTLGLSPLSSNQVEDLIRNALPDMNNDDVRALARLGEGSAGRSLDLAQQGGLIHYMEMISLLRGLPRLDIPALHAFAEKVARGDDGFRVTSALLLWWLGRIISAGGRKTEPAEVIPGENGLLRTLLASATLAQWVEVWEKISHLVDRTDAVNLDKKQVLLSAFLAVERLVRPA